MRFAVSFFLISSVFINAQQKLELTTEMANKLASMPLKCINQEYPNKTAHVINAEKDAILTPKQLHPSFYGCFDWHSSVHGHWMLVRLLRTVEDLENRDKIISILDDSFSPEKIKEEASYFTKYQVAQNFERTYGWAWVLKLDEELARWNHPKAKIWHQNLKPLTDEILRLWKAYLPKQTYPNRTGVHPNTAFAMSFAIDWARQVGGQSFETELSEKAKIFYLNNTKTPAYLEPDGSDFFSPSLEIAELMSRILPQREFEKWLNQFYEKRSLENIEQIPIISDVNDYQTVHLVGLSFSKAWAMKNIIKVLPEKNSIRKQFEISREKFIENSLPIIFQGNYGGDHWLASFAVYALTN
ncbi:DUF2891 domain-containing protein [Epilithonimonas arachidiradicis]|uniref:DUF2891 domain-containing protein n=1 Tax=Epilithonimonas arachidiradicis TaxID=1617282 RepID=A0A420CX85_9FLAO|nr:DUF2891 domain-containing protein [Epilithonimonas arachidiradicis]RKE83081.1 Protein of unknown function (DUF2891) [Epilithonimonas arachidiradicis]GGG64863.1 hypothetical protein GCM10007332_29090 [Epilithonimonas arachidiradicis]